MTRAATPADRARLAALVAAVAADRGVPLDQVLGADRVAALVRVRFAVAWLARTALGAGWPAIGAALGGRDHTTIVHAARRAEQLRATDADFRALTDRLLAGLVEP